MKNNVFRNKSILVTGATGSIGSAITELFLKYDFKVFRAISNDENGIYELSEKLKKKGENLSHNMIKNKIRYLIGDIRDQKRCNEICKDIDIVVHAAALKHVPVCEYNPKEALKTNFYGTKNMINASLKNKVKKFLFISTDKVVNPTSIMGLSKKKAEKLVLLSNKKKGGNTKFSVIRFGNIIGSRGSVLLKFLSQIQNNENLTITNKKMTRFFITIDSAIKEIINAITLMKGNEIFLIKNMKSIRIYDLALSLKQFFTFKKKIIFQGSREGEKNYEELASNMELSKIKELKNLLIISKKGKKSKKNNYIINSDYGNFLNKKQIINFLKTSKLI
jgi:UDP-N-acetylglucosamine 4,6-dehydratase